MTIGERLEEERKRKGVSIRDASEATKIRGEYLMSLESDSHGEIPLPEIYIRGFIRNYASYLKMDMNQVITDLDAIQLGPSSRGPAHNRSEGREVLGRMNLPDKKVDPSSLPPKDPDAHQESRQRGPEGGARVELEDDESFPYLKVGISVLGIFIIVALLWLIVSLVRNPSPDLPDDSQPSSGQVTEQSTDINDYEEEAVTIIAEDYVTVIVIQRLDGARLYQSTLDAGEEIVVNKRGPILVRFSNGEAVTIRKGSEVINVDTAGPDQVTVE